MEQGLCQDGLCGCGQAAHHGSTKAKHVKAQLGYGSQQNPSHYWDQRSPDAPLEVFPPDQPLKNHCIAVEEIGQKLLKH